MAATDLLFDTTWLPVLDAAAKATLLLSAAGLTCWMLRRASAATRHLVWTLALVAALALPALSISLPRWELPLIAVVGTSQTSAARTLSSPAPTEPDASRSVSPAPPPVAERAIRASDTGVPAPDASPSVQPAPSALEGRTTGTAVVSWPVALAILWAIGTAAILLRLLIGIVAVQWISRRSQPVTDAPWLPLARSLACDLGVPRVRFLRSSRATMPMAVGIVRPAVLMPAEADEWPAERLRIVLLHELAHVRRRDCLTHAVAQVACAVYWFNPLAWIAARHVRTERERACDDLVLASGTHGPDYADQLLEIARVMRSGRFPAVLASASLAMAHRSQLEGRLMAILDPRVPRSGVGRGRTSLATAAAVAALVPLASLQPWAQANEPPPAPRPVRVAAAQTPAPPAPAPQRPPAPAPSPTPAPAVPELPAARASAPDAETAAAVVSEAVREGVAGAVEAVVEWPSVAFPVVVEYPAIVEGAVAAALQETSPKIAATAQTSRKADPKTIAALTAALKDTDQQVRETALQALVHLRDPSAFEPLLQALTDGSAEIRAHAAAWLGQMRDRRALEPLIAAMKDQNVEVRQQVAFALGQLRDRLAIPALTAALKDANPEVRGQVVFALGQLRDPATLDGLAAALRDDRAEVRGQAAFALGQLRDRRAADALIGALKDTSANVRQQAVFALGQIRDKAAVEALIFALKDTSVEVRSQAAFALGQIRDPRAIDALTEALKDANAGVRQQAAFALGQLIR